MIEAMSYRAQALPWWMISTVRRDTVSHRLPQKGNNEQGDWRPCWPAPLWSLAERDGLWLQLSVWDTREVGVLWNPESLEAFWQCAMLTCQWTSLAGWKCSAGKRPGATVLWHEPVHDWDGRRTSAERSRQQRDWKRLKGGWQRFLTAEWWHLSFYCDPKQTQY